MGEANHAGSTQMSDRKDALVAASQFVTQVSLRVKELGKPYTVATLGCIRVEPSAVNVIPGKCVFSLEIRDQDAELMDAVSLALRADLDKICQAGELTYTWQEMLQHPPMPMHDGLKSLIIDQAQVQDIPCTQLPSGAFHDSLLLAGHFPTAMIFVASVDGKSHCKGEYTRPEDLGHGLALLLASVLAADKTDFKI